MLDNVLKDYLDIIEKRIDELLPKTTKQFALVNDAARYSLLLGGKRIRPIIMLEFARVNGANFEGIIDFAVALEMIHTYSLIHDDLPCMDNDDMRRGKPSCHKAYGEDIALLAGDKLLTTAFAVAAKANLPQDRVVKAMAVLADRANGMINGQVLDLNFEKVAPNQDELKTMYLLKTGCLISAAAEIGCILAGADEETCITAQSYATNLALAFQIIDDILDITGNEQLLGKPIGSDQKNNKTTLATLLGLEQAKILANTLTEEAIALLKTINSDTSFLQELTEYLLNRNF